ncbi:GNAT family protein [Paracoccus cavernae]|uniref:GNAT family protein n=1 Tax=Paracoccus cavernae TaxID=1571207 RepID=A0ABT8DD94_9RHOB|nr:GNAT family protein [Paracoccus cavernae]
MAGLADWRAPERPERRVIEGRYARLEPVDPACHAATLYQAARAEGTEARFRYLFDAPPQDEAAMRDWLARAAASDDPLHVAVIDRRSGRAEGRQALMRITPEHGVIEIGSIMWGPAMTRSRIATEALFLAADQVFAQGYRRFEWKCDDGNLPSKKAALRFGFSPEGVFRQHMVVKGRNRDTAWFAMTDADWPDLRGEYLRWLDPANFDAAGQEQSKLRF